MPFERVFVEWYGGEKASECPMAFILNKQRRIVAGIIDRWHEGGLQPGRPRVDYFKVKTVEGKVFFLRYVSLFDAWSIWVEESEGQRFEK